MMDYHKLTTDVGSFFVKNKKRIIIYGSIILSITLIIVIICLACSSSDSNNKESKFNTDSKSSTNSFVVCYDSSGNLSRNCIGGWMYSPFAKTVEENVKWMQKHNWNFGLISSSIKTTQKKENLLNLSKECAKNNIAYHIMTLQDVAYLDDFDHAISNLNEILNFVQENDLKIAGIHIDVEPHQHTDWKNGDDEAKSKVFHTYLDLLKLVKTEIKNYNQKYNKNLLFSIAVPAWFSKWTKSGRISEGLGSDLVNDDRADMLVSMNYENSKANLAFIEKQTKDYFEDGAKMIIGVNYKDYGATDEGFNNINNQIFDRFYKNETIGDLFYGTCVYQNKYYSDWST